MKKILLFCVMMFTLGVICNAEMVVIIPANKVALYTGKIAPNVRLEPRVLKTGERFFYLVTLSDPKCSAYFIAHPEIFAFERRTISKADLPESKIP